MPKTDTLIRTKLSLPFTRSALVPRPRLQEQINRGLCGPLTLVTAPAGFGKTTLVAAFVVNCGASVAWLSLDINDNQQGRFLRYLVAALQETDPRVGSEAAELLATSQPALHEAILTSLINDLDRVNTDIVLVLDDYQSISNQAVHEAVTFLLEHCPRSFHLVIASRSDPPLHIARLRIRGQIVELRAADLRFTETESAQFLNDVMHLHLDVGSVAALAERTEGWIAGLQMAALSMRDRENVREFIAKFSGTNRYILDYLIEEVLASQPPETHHFLLYTSILERLSAPLCKAVLEDVGLESRRTGQNPAVDQLADIHLYQQTLEDIERANLFLVPLDDERTWYRYHHLFADLLRTQLQKAIGEQGVTQLHLRAAAWHEQNGSLLDAIHHASLVSDEGRVERLIEQLYLEMVSRGEMWGYRFWSGKLSKELVYRRPWLCIYEAYSHSWFGELDEAEQLIDAAEKHIQSEPATDGTQPMQAYLAYIKSRVTAMRGDIHQAIEFCLAARAYSPAGNLALQLDTCITLGYEYFLSGDYASACQVLDEAIQTGLAAGGTIYVVASACILARLYANQGRLQQSADTYRWATQLISGASGEHRDARALAAVGMAEVYCEWNDLEAALAHVKQGLALLPFWGKTDDSILAYVILARIYLAQANRSQAQEAVEKASQLVQSRGIFSEARNAVEAIQVKMWLAQGDRPSVDRWVSTFEKRFGSPDPFRFEDELSHITQARVLMAQNKVQEAIHLLSSLEEATRSGGRQGRLIECLVLKALALQAAGEASQALLVLEDSLGLAESNRYMRIFLDEGQPMRALLARWLAHSSSGKLRDYADHLLSQLEAELDSAAVEQKKTSHAGEPQAASSQPLVEPLSQRELEVLRLMASGRTNKEIARELIVAPGTVKAHTASIYRKLDVANRTQAVARARQLAILP